MRFCLSHMRNWLCQKWAPQKPVAQTQPELMERLSHELRTSLTGIVGYSEFVESSATEPMVNFTAKIIRESSLGLARASNAFFDLYRLNSGQIKIEPSVFAVNEEVRSVVRAHQKQALDHDVNLIFTCSAENFPLEIDADVQKVRQVVDALIHWAIHLVDKQQSIHVDISGDEDSQAVKLMIIFSDTLISNAQTELLQDFWTNDAYKFRLQEGPGVELAFAKALIALLQGDVVYRTAFNELPRLELRLPVEYNPSKVSV